MRALRLFLSPLLLGIVAGCGSNSSTSPTNQNAPPPAPNPSSDIGIVLGASTKTTTAFSPNPKAVALGGAASVTIRWINEDITGNDYQTGTATTHQIMSDNTAFATSPPLGGNGTYSITLSAAGKYTYHCAIHPNMVGEIDVTP
jgi:plastocyanin